MSDRPKKKKTNKDTTIDLFKEIEEIEGIVEITLKKGKKTEFVLSIDEVPVLELKKFYLKIENLIKKIATAGIDVTQFDKKTEDGKEDLGASMSFLSQIPTLLKIATDEIIEIICLGIDKDLKWFEEKRISIHDISLILLGILKANKAQETEKNFKSLVAQMSTMKSSDGN